MNEQVLNNHAYAFTMAVKTLVEAMGMYAENQHHLSLGHSIAYGQAAFDKLIEDNGCHHNAVLTVLEQGR